MKNLRFEYENFPNESLGQLKHFKHVFGVEVGCEFDKIPGSYKKRVYTDKVILVRIFLY